MGMNTCPMCGKQKVIMWPQFWPYRRGETYYCSEDCMMVDQAKDMKLIHMLAHIRAKKGSGIKMEQKLTHEQKKQAVQIAIDGGDPLEFLAKCGSANPVKMWGHIRSIVKEKDPELFAKIPDRRVAKKTPAQVHTVKYEDVKKDIMEIPQIKVDGPLRIETPEANWVQVVETPEKPKQIYNPVKYDGMVIREVEGLFGRYRRSDVGGAVYIDFENAERIDTLSFTVEQWRGFGKEFVKCARILGVEM